ncbi:MAG: CHASE3 domain-containing protein [Terricaulis sp.]
MPDSAIKSVHPWLPRADRLVLVATVMLVACTAALAVGLFLLARMQSDAATAGAGTRAMRSATFSLLQAALDAETGQRGYLLTNDESFLEPYDRGAANASVHIQNLRELTAGDPPLRALADRADGQAIHALSLLEESIALRRNGRLTSAQVHAVALQSKESMNNLRATAGELLTNIESRADAIREQNAKTRLWLNWVGAILASLSLIAAGLAAWGTRFERKSWRESLAVMVRANYEAENARQKAAASDLAKTRFLAAASHDMRQPLHALTLYLSALQRRVEGEEARAILTKMERATQSMVGMFSTLLDLARIQADVVTPEIEIFPLQDVLDRIIAEHPGADLAGPSPPTYLEVRSDPVLLERLLRNLVSNALRHGGGAARISVQRMNDVAEIAVTDKGAGIAPEDQERVFEEFVRLDGRSGAEGLGLGLAIVKRIADLLHADLELRSAPGEGASFLLRLPIEQASHAAPSAAPSTARIVEGMPILVMDDEPLALEAVAGTLRDLGAHVRACANEADLNALLDEGFSPRILVMDLRIKGELEGVDIADRARARLEEKPRVIMVTGDTAPETLSALRASGHAWLIKPVSRDDLASAVARARTSAEIR